MASQIEERAVKLFRGDPDFNGEALEGVPSDPRRLAPWRMALRIGHQTIEPPAPGFRV